jgi:ABC-2 type transport system permease protein
MNDLALYLRYLGISLRGQLQYRMSFVLQTVGHFLVTAIEFIAIWVLFDRFDHLQDWSLAEVAVFYGFINVSFAFSDAFARGFDLFGAMVKSGEFDRILLRPRLTVLQLAGQELTLRRIGRLIQGAAVLAWGCYALELTLTTERVGLAVLVLGGNFALFSGLVVVQATMAFWTVETLELMNSFTYGGVHAAQYPMNIYGKWLRRLFTYVVPLAATSYFPIVAFLNRPDPMGSPAWMAWLTPLAGFVFLAAALGFWQVGVRHYTSTGS